MYIDIHDVSVEYKQDNTSFLALDHINLAIERGEFICLLGPSGCGKTTLLNAIAGFEKVTSGTITIDGTQVTKPDTRYVTIFQNYGLLPWRTVEKNVALPLETKHLDKQEQEKRIEHYLELVGLSDFKDRHPHQLSGGQQQRVAIARALAVNPDILFMD